jgi:predicted PurR-regulated permease PerM
MFIGASDLIWALLVALGAYWCYAIIKRFGSDMKELREVEETPRKAAIIIIWAITAIIAVAVVTSLLPLAARIISAIREVL